jgi:hypothetical protein
MFVRSLPKYFLTLVVGAAGTVIGQETPPFAVHTSDGAEVLGARALWSTVVDLIKNEYFELDDATGSRKQWTERAITVAVSKLLSEEAVKREDKVSLGELPSDNEKEIRDQFLVFIEKLQARTRDSDVDSLPEWVEHGIQLFCAGHLKFSSYESKAIASEISRNRLGQGSFHPDFSILQSLEDGVFQCHPYSEDVSCQSWKFGIRNGDELVSIDGAKIAGWSISKVGSRFYGEQGSKISINLRQASGRILSVPTTRSVSFEPVVVKPGVHATEFKIHQFNESTSKELQALLIKYPNSNIVIDLRGNGGGRIDDVLEPIGLFISGDRPLIVGKILIPGKPPKELKTDIAPLRGVERLTLIVNGGTASISELFIQALLDAKEATPKIVVSGEKTFGKDLLVGVITLDGQGGGALQIPVGEMRTAQDSTWGKGILPTLNVKHK